MDGHIEVNSESGYSAVKPPAGSGSRAQVAVQSAVDAAIRQGTEVGMQVAAYLDGELLVEVFGGWASRDTEKLVDASTLFNVYSVTKAVAVTALHIQAERGFVDYAAPVARYWPEFAAHSKDTVTIRDVLTHRSGVYQMPDDVTPERMIDWNWMIQRIADTRPAFAPGSKSGYQSMTFGWIVGEIVCRTDRAKRTFNRFVLEEIAGPLKIDDLWIGIPASIESRVAALYDGTPIPYPEDSLYRLACPRQVDLCASVFARPEVRGACIPGVGGIFNARSIARFFAFLANGGELGGVRLLSRERVESFRVPRINPLEPDAVFFGKTLPMGTGGFWLGGSAPPVCAVANPRSICHPGMGGSIAWADPDRKLAVGVCHNLAFTARSCEEDRILPIATALRRSLGFE